MSNILVCLIAFLLLREAPMVGFRSRFSLNSVLNRHDFVNPLELKVLPAATGNASTDGLDIAFGSINANIFRNLALVFLAIGSFLRCASFSVPQIRIPRQLNLFHLQQSTVASQPGASLGAATSGKLVLRCRSPSGQLNIELPSDSTVGDLADKVCSLTDLTKSCLSLRYGYPLKRLDLGPENCSKLLSQVPILNGESIVADSTEPRQVNNTPSAASTIPATQPSIIRLIAPSDNCCLFTSVSTCVENGNSLRAIDAPVVTNAEGVQETRNLIAGFVQSDPENFNQGILGMAPEAYIKNIMRPDCWGGGIEVSILSKIYELEINVVDVLTGRIDKFGEDKAYQQRILLLYDGIHYDPLAMSYPNKGTVQTIFPTSMHSVLDEARNLAASVRKAGQFTDLTNCNLMCSICRTPLKGQQGAQQHAASTGHAQFQERQ